MRAPFCPDTMDSVSKDQTSVGSKEEYSMSDEIHVIEKSSVKKHSCKTAVFGICLENLMDKSPKRTVPFVLSRLCCYIEKHGLNDEKLFQDKEEGGIAEQLKLTFDKSGDAPLEAVGNVPSASRLLKSFFEELPEPLIPISMRSTFVNDMEKYVHSPEDSVKLLKCFVDKLPDTTFHVLKYLSRFLLRVASHQEMNGMSAVKLGVEFGPILFRPPNDDPLFYIIIKNVTNYFVSDYYAIFEEAALSSTGDPICTMSSKSAFKTYSGLSRRKIAPYPSSVMPLAAMQPLSVVIPPVESALQKRDQRSENNRKVPILLIERFKQTFLCSSLFSDVEKTTEVNGFKQMCMEGSATTKEKNDTPLPTRKRKERRPSGDDLQVQRSSSEERPSPISDVSLEKGEFMRRCSSHEEMKELANQTLEINEDKDRISKLPIASDKSLKAIGLYFAEPLDQDISNRDHSPHPPNPKRREIDSSDFRHCKAQSQKDLAEQNNTAVGSISGHNARGSMNSRIYLNNIMDCKAGASNGRKINFDTITHIEERNTLTTFETSTDNDMDCSASDDLTSEESFSPTELAAYNSADAEVVSDSIKIRIPRSASCPIPKRDDENCPDPREDDVHLSLSWNMLFETEDNEPIRSEHRFSWPLLKSFQDDDTLLSPSVHSLRKSSSYEAPLSPSAFRSYLSYRSSHLDPSVPPSPPVEQEDFGKSPVKEDVTSATIKQLTKKIHSLRKKIRRFDEFYESEYGYKPSHAEKANHPDSKKLMADLHRARKELKALKEEAHVMSVSGSVPQWSSSKEAHILEDTTNCVRDENLVHKDGKPKHSIELSYGTTLKTLADERRLAKRPESVDEMTKEQVQDEKASIQKALLHFESIYGRPAKKSDRNAMRPLYDRYRNIKKLLVRSSSFSSVNSKVKDTCTELQPILEHETMDFTSPQHRKSNKNAITDTEENKDKEEHEEEHEEEEEEEEAAAAAAAVVQAVAAPIPEAKEENSDEKIIHRSAVAFQHLATKYNNSNLHELPISEMIFQQQQARSEKRRLRKILREFEDEFYRLNGRKVQKEDKVPVETLYAEYKHVKARLRLLEALVSKHDHHQLT